MAVLTDAEARDLFRNFIFRKSLGKAEVKATGGPPGGAVPLPLNKNTVKAVLQALEDWYEGERSTVKSALDAAAGVTLSNASAKKIAAGFLAWKARRE